MRAKKITVYDRSDADRGVAVDALRELFERASAKAVVNEFADRETFAYDFRDNHYDMAFVGIGSMLDFEAARAIRGLDSKCPLFLMSRVEEYAIEGYRLNALDYIIKPVTEARLRDAVSRASPSFFNCV